MPAKNLRLGPLAVRGCVDGDGTILVYTDQYRAAKTERYVYERLYVSLVSASLPVVEWLQATVDRLVHISGAIHESRRGRRSIWVLRYAKAASIRLLRWMHYAPDVPRLLRKRAKAERFLVPLGDAPRQPVGRPRAGWRYNVVAVGPGQR